jgi:hypothetical protein
MTIRAYNAMTGGFIFLKTQKSITRTPTFCLLLFMGAFIHSDYWPFVVLLLSLAIVVAMITRWRFSSLLCAYVSCRVCWIAFAGPTTGCRAESDGDSN